MEVLPEDVEHNADELHDDPYELPLLLDTAVLMLSFL